MSKLAGNTRAALLGVLFAMVGFSYALATSAGLGEASASAAGRAVGTNVALQFTNPIIDDSLGTDRDLGDAVAGSAFARYCRAKGGCPPYKFTSTVDPKLSSLSLDLAVALNGLVSPTAGTTTISAKATLGAKRFKVTVADSSGTNTGNSTPVTEMFRITVVDGSVFKFAIGPDLGGAVKFQSFITTLAVIGNATPAKFEVPTGTDVKLDGVKQDNLEAVGLALANDGTLYGKPFAAGVLTFTAKCTGKGGEIALSRDGTKQNQDFTLAISDNNQVNSSVVTTAIQIKGGNLLVAGKAGKDSIKYAGIANLLGNKISALAGKVVTLRIGAYTTPNTKATPGTLDDKGKSTKSTESKDVLKTAVTLKAAVSSKGQVKIAVGRETFNALGATNAFGALKAGSGVLLGVAVDVGGVAVSTEVLPFDITEKSGKYTLTYKLGMAVPAGNFLVTTCAGKDDTKATVVADHADAWKVAFLAQPAAKTAGKSGNMTAGSFAGAKNAAINIGASFEDSILVTEKKGKIKSSVALKSRNRVSKLAMDSVKGKGSMQTTFVNESSTSILMAKEAKVGAAGATDLGLNIALDSTAPFAGDGGLVIYSTGKAWTEKTPK